MSADNKAERIYDAVLQLVNEQRNPAKITISEIADKSGIGKGTVYEYFSSKEDVFLKTFAHLINLIIDDTRRMSRGTFKEMFYDYYYTLIKIFEKSTAAFVTILFGENGFNVNTDTEEKIMDIVIPLREEMKTYITEMIGKGVSESIINIPMDIIEVFYANMGLVSLIFAAQSEMAEADILNRNTLSPEMCYKYFVKQLR
jgi:AcrR family transcriptional regulator